MNDLHKLRAAQIDAAERAVIASIPTHIMEVMRKAEDAFKARGGCKGCGSMVLAVHKGSCPTLKDDFY